VLRIHEESVDADLVSNVKQILTLLEESQKAVETTKHVEVEPKEEQPKPDLKETIIEDTSGNHSNEKNHASELPPANNGHVPVPHGLQSWQYEGVTQWLESVGLGEYGDKFVSLRINGRALRELSRRVDSHDFFKLVEESLKISIFGDILVLADALRELRH